MTPTWDPETGERIETLPINPQNVSQLQADIARINAALDEGVPELYDLREKLGGLEVDWKHARAVKLVELADEDDRSGEKRTVSEREARTDADPHVAETHRAYVLMRERVRAQGEHLHTLRAQLSSLQTLGRIVEGVT